MSLTYPFEIDFYIDGELGPEEASEVEASLESDMRARALLDAVWRQKEALTRALEALDIPSAASRRTAELQAVLAQALSRRLMQSYDPQSQHKVLKET